MQIGILFPAAFRFAQQNSTRCDCENYILIAAQLHFLEPPETSEEWMQIEALEAFFMISKSCHTWMKKH